jgi:hypothetical protein
VLQGRDTGAADLTAQLAEDGSSFTVTLQHPALGSARLVFNKGENLSGGQVGYSASGIPSSLAPFLDRVQGITVTDNGPVWEDLNVVREQSAKGGSGKGMLLLQNTPNPFNPATQITYRIANRESRISKENPRFAFRASALVNLSIYNTQGKRVRTLVQGEQAPGLHRVIWDGRDERDKVLPSGVYVCRLEAGNDVMIRKMALIK